MNIKTTLLRTSKMQDKQAILGNIDHPNPIPMPGPNNIPRFQIHTRPYPNLPIIPLLTRRHYLFKLIYIMTYYGVLVLTIMTLGF